MRAASLDAMIVFAVFGWVCVVFLALEGVAGIRRRRRDDRRRPGYITAADRVGFSERPAGRRP